MMAALVIHVPVIHRGYLELFRRLAPEIAAVYILGDELTSRFRFFEHDISSLPAAEAERLIGALGLGAAVSVLTPGGVAALRGRPLVLINDELSRRFAAEFLPSAPIRWESVFLRWDESHVQRRQPVHFDRQTADALDRAIIEAAYTEAAKSGDWWRQVGAVLVRDGAIVARAYNRDMPDDQSSYRFGNIRDFLKPGEKSEFSNTFHVENRIVAEAARAGASTAGAHLYVTHFPCPMCAKAIAVSGIAKCFFAEGSANFDAEMILRTAGVEMVYVPR